MATVRPAAMVNGLPTGPRGRALALGIAAVMLVAVWMMLVRPILSWKVERDEVLAQRQNLAFRMAGLAAQLPTLRQQADAAAEHGSRTEMLLPDGTDALASAALQGRLEEMLHDCRVTLASAETLPAQQAGDYRRIAMRLTVTGAWPQLVTLLIAIGHSAPTLLIDDVQVQAGALQLVRGKSGASQYIIADVGQRDSQGGGRTTMPPLKAVFTVFGFRAASASPVADPAAPPAHR